MKRYKIAISALALLGATTLQSCLDFDVTGAEFSQTQKNEEKVTRSGAVDSINYKAQVSEADFRAALDACQSNLATAMGGIFALRGGKKGEYPGEHAYQYQFTFSSDLYAQYGVIPHVNFPYSGINLISSYAIDEKCYAGAYGSFNEVSSQVVPLLNMKEIDQLPEMKAIFLLVYDIAALDVADVNGPLPYQDLKLNKQKHPYTYDNLETVYKTIEANIDTIVNTLKYFDQKEDWYKKAVLNMVTNYVPLNEPAFVEGSYTSLEPLYRLANSIKLRMAMHIVKRDAALAQQWAEEAVASGVIERTEDEAGLYPFTYGKFYPLIQIYKWGDMRMGAGFQQVLEAMDHPYLESLFTKNELIKNSKDPSQNLPAGTKVIGIRTGAHVGQEQGSTSNPYNGFSSLNEMYLQMAPLYVMKLSEVCFLRAEGALRGWNMGGTAQQFYEEGIKYGDCQDRVMKMDESYDNALATYLQKAEATPFTYVDPTGDTDPVVSKIKIGVQWNESDSRETKLEKIITQKYIAAYPISFEPWVDLRRTGYPRLFDALNPGDGDGSLQPGDIIRRVPFPNTSDQAVLQDINATGMDALGGPDKQATRLWWDVDAPNF